MHVVFFFINGFIRHEDCVMCLVPLSPSAKEQLDTESFSKLFSKVAKEIAQNRTRLKVRLSLRLFNKKLAGLKGPVHERTSSPAEKLVCFYQWHSTNACIQCVRVKERVTDVNISILPDIDMSVIAARSRSATVRSQFLSVTCWTPWLKLLFWPCSFYFYFVLTFCIMLTDLLGQ